MCDNTIIFITIITLEILFETLDTSRYAQYYIMWKDGISKRRQTTQGRVILCSASTTHQPSHTSDY